MAQKLSAEWDERIEQYRLPAYHYHKAFSFFFTHNIPVEDQAREYKELNLSSKVKMKPFPYQEEALREWEKTKKGVIVLPTGSGKSYLATLTIEKVRRSTLIIVPTIDLMNQWYDILTQSFHIPIGLIGGGYYDLQDITVTTYDSAYLFMERFGNRFAFLIFDECHHLPGETYALSARLSIAPYRLGLTATPERADGKEVMLNDLIGPYVFRKDINELSGVYLAEYETITLNVELTKEQREEYLHYRQIYLDFLRKKRINMSYSNGWNMFIIESSRSEEGRTAFKAYRRQKEIFIGSEAKLELLEQLLHQHHKDRILIFTEDNYSVYEISKRFLVPSITHLTKTKERKEVLDKFNKGDLGAIVTSKVLNEGINVPDANVAVILSGNASIREHVQRLGRILRKKGDKQATLYEVVTLNTAEESMSERRRQHRAYR